MNFFLVAQQGAPKPGWSLQYTLDLKPAAARTYEPLSLATHTTASNIEHLITFYELTGESSISRAFLKRSSGWKRSLAQSRCRRPHASHVHRARHEQAAVRAPARLQRRER